MQLQTQFSLFLGFSILFALSQPTLAQENGSSLREQIIGEWVAISVVSSGKKTAIPGERTQELNLKFREKDFEVREHKAKADKADGFKGSYLLNADLQPATLDLILGNSERDKIVGIVRIEDGKLILCVDSLMGRLKRPNKFESTEGSGFDLVIFKRVANKN